MSQALFRLNTTVTHSRATGCPQSSGAKHLSHHPEHHFNHDDQYGYYCLSEALSSNAAHRGRGIVSEFSLLPSPLYPPCPTKDVCSESCESTSKPGHIPLLCSSGSGPRQTTSISHWVLIAARSSLLTLKEYHVSSLLRPSHGSPVLR